jgi:molybdenum cofactor synthesis domain-containing protein
MQTPTACLIIIGNEILSGRTQDKNLAWLARELNEAGVRLMEVRVIPDIEATIIATINACRPAFTYVFTTGGIGPTHDDITSAAVARAFGVPLEPHPEAVAILEKHYTKEQLNAARLKMAETPRGASLIENPVSAAPGFRMENVYVMAGVPSIMQAMFANIKHELKGGARMLSKTVSAYITEGVIAEKLSAIQDRYPGVEIGSYPFIRQQRLGVSLVARGTDEGDVQGAYQEIKNMLLGFTQEVEETDLAVA